MVRALRRRAGALAVLAGLVAPALPAGGDIATGLFNTARQLERGGQLDQAREAYGRVVEAAPRSDLADDALLALARLAWPVDSPEALGRGATMPGSDWQAARTHLERIADDYVTSDQAPEALWRLGLLMLDPDAAGRDPDAAAARLLSLPELYPQSPRAPEALALVAELDTLAGRSERARAIAFRVLWRWPGSGRADARAWRAAGLLAARAGRAERALFCFGRARVAGDAGGSSARLARLVERLALKVPQGEPAWKAALDAQLALPERIDDLVAARDGRLFAAMARENAVAEIDAAGTDATRRPMAGVRGVALDGWSRAWLLTPEAIVGPAGVGRIPVPEDVDAVSLAITGARGLWLADRRGRRVIRLGADGTIEATVPLADRGEPRALVPADRGGVFILDARNDRLLKVDARGAPAGWIALSGIVRRPQDAARDPLGNLYVLDSDPPRVVVLSPEGKPVARVSLPVEGDRGIARPAHIAVDESGRIAVADARRRRITWLR